MRRQQILEAAKRIFARCGFKGATIEEIAGEAELSTGTLYLYFKSKDEIYFSLNMKILTFLNRKLKALKARNEPSLRTRIRECLHVFLSMYHYDPFAVRFLFHIQTGDYLKGLSPEVRSELIELSQTAIRTIAAIITMPAQEEITIKGHPAAIADSLWSVFSGLVIWEESKASLKGRNDYLDSTLDLAAEIFFRGLTSGDRNST
ncbi:MAG: TetR/AcrR family transcriptional regulator [Desulfomonilaceae bacterium]|nr:TetR/AcrR family transcriptional regulator [Desulfomonilaceae bacterium]